MAINLVELKSFSISSNSQYIEAKLFYPKLVLIEDKSTIYIIDLEKQDEKKHELHLEQEIVDNKLIENFLWLVLNTGELTVVDVLLEKQFQIINNKSLKINHIISNENRLYFASESGDMFQMSYQLKDLKGKLIEGVNALSVSLNKVSATSHLEIKNYYTNNMFGLNIYVEVGAIWIQCPLTGIKEKLLSDNNVLQYVVSWKDKIILANDFNMWIVDYQDTKIIYEFKQAEGNYIPMTEYKDVLYYVLWNKNMVQVCGARMIQEHLDGCPRSTDNFDSLSQILTSQDMLKEQLRSKISTITVTTKPGIVLPQMQELYKSIDDLNFLVDITQQLCQLNITFKSLLYELQNRISLSCDESLLYKVNDLSIKVDLIEYMNFTGNNNYEIVNIYEQNYKQLCITFISHSDFDIASICWIKYAQLQLDVTTNDVVNILNAVNNNTKIASIFIWIKNLIPALLEKNPFYIDLFVRWASEKVFMLEQSPYWPKIGLKFVEETIQILETSFRSVPIRPVSMDDLDMLKTRITYLIELKDKYKINMLLNELSSQSTNEVALIMLRRCYTEDLKPFLKDYLPSYALQNSLDLDDILSTYIENEAASSGGGIDGNRLIMLLDAFHSYNNKLDCLLQVLKVLDVPWNPVVLDLTVSFVSNTNKNFSISDTERILAQEIQKEINYANVKIVLKKYNFSMTCRDYMLVLNKIVSAPSIEIEDLKIITSMKPTFSNYGYILYIERCLKDCEIRTALHFFKDLSPIDKRVLIKAVIAKYDQVISGDENNLTLERNYIDFIKSTHLLKDIEIKNIESLYHFKNSYGMSIGANEMYNEKHCVDSVNSWVSREGGIASSGRGSCVMQLIQTCQPQYSELMMLLKSTSMCHKVRIFVEYLIRLLTNGYVVDFVAALQQYKNGDNLELLVKAYSVLIELVTKCNEEHLHELIEHLCFVHTLINASIVVKNLSIAWKFHYVFLPIASSTAVDELIHHYKTRYSDALKLDYPIASSKCDFTSLRIISSISVNSQVANLEMYEDISDLSKRILAKVAAFHELDEILLTSLILILKTCEQNQSSVIDLLSGQNECVSPNIIGYLSSPPIRRAFNLDDDTFIRELGNTVSYPPQYVLKTKFKINLADVALPENSEETWDVKVILFYVLLQYPNTCFDRLVELCRALNISTNEGLSLQLVALLSTWELKYKISIDELGSKAIFFNEDVNQLDKCLVIWDSIENKDFLKDILNDFWKNGEVTLHGRQISINPYYYEVYLCIYRLVYGNCSEVRNTKEYFLLHFLKDYKRKSSPKQYEYELFSVKGMFPEVGHFRLPFHLFMREDMWSNLKSEITLDTYERWIPAVSLLALDSDTQTAKDMICSNAVKQTMTSRKCIDGEDSHNKHEPWSLTSTEEPLLRAAHRCVRHIANMEWAGACLFYVLQGCARGADQVAAAHLCYQFAQRWAAVQPGNRAVRQMERLHANLSTRHALNKIHWACEEFLRLLAEPAQLIRTMYQHPDFVLKMNKYDVNRTINEIADKNGINVSSIRMQILENILEKSNLPNKQQIVLNIKELMTAKCILKATCPKMGAIYLSRIAFDDESDNNKCKKLRALQCLMSVVDCDTAIKVTNRERDALWLSLVDLLSVVYLESIDMPWIAATFGHSKTRALEQLVQSTEGNSDGLKVAAELTYKFGTTQMMRNLIPILLRAGLYEEMIPLLLKLSTSLDNLICSAWRAVILFPFQRADYPITEGQRKRCINAVNLLPVCPIINDQDLVEIWKNCMRCKCYGLGCLLLPYMTAQTRQTLTELQKIDKRNLIASLKNLHAETYLVSGAMHVIEKMMTRSYR